MQTASSNPRLVAALDANVDRKTLLDLLVNEPWWEPFRRSVDGHALIRVGATPEFATNVPPEMRVAPLVDRARAGGRAASALRVVGDDVFLVAASAVALPGRGELPVLVACKLLSSTVLASVAERAHGLVAISDGRRLLVKAAAPSVAMGPADVAELSRMLATQGPATAPGSGNTALAAVPLGNDLQLIVRTAASGQTSAAPPIAWPIWATLAFGVLAAGGTFMQLARRGRSAPALEQGLAIRRPTTLTSVGRYAIVNRIGQGGMAEIYAAVSRGEEGFRRPVVIKRLRPELAADANAVAQFCDEANLLAALHHPNIVGVQDFGRAGDELFLAEEYVLGRDFGRVIERSLARDGRPPAPQVVAHVCRELLEALEYAHNMTNEQGQPMGIVHRDVSPENIMVSSRGEVKLLDFGVVKTAEGRATKTEFGVIKGNVMFMSPEQARGLDVDARADLYAVGLTMYFGLTGRTLYKSQTTYGLLLKAGNGPDLGELAAAKDVPEPFRPVLQRALSRNIDDRYQTARDMIADLEPLVREGVRMTVASIARLFKEELEQESRRLSTFVPAVEGGTNDRTQLA